MVGFTTGTHDYHVVGNPTPYIGYDIEGTSYGGFAGYNIQRSNIVFGGEVGVSTGDVQIAGSIFPEYTYDFNIDLKARAGYAVGRALIFGEVGYGMAHWGGANTEDNNLTGISYGIGVDYAITDRVFVGIEYIARNLNGVDTILVDREVNTSQQTITGRIGMNF